MNGEEEVPMSQREALMQLLLSGCGAAKMTRVERFYALTSLRGELNAWLRLEGVHVQSLEEAHYE